MSWNFRVIHKVYDDGTEEYGIHEVYYNELDQPEMVSENAIPPIGNTFLELIEDLKRYSRAMEKVVLEYDDFSDGES